MSHCLSCPCKTGTQKAWVSLLRTWAGTLCYHTLSGTGQQVGKLAEGTLQKGQPCTTGYAGCKAGICSLRFPSSWLVENQLTHVFSGLYTYKQFPRIPGEWQGQYKGKISHPEWLLSQRKNQAEATFLYSCQKSIPTSLQNILTRYFANPVRLSVPEKVSLNWQSAQYDLFYLLYSQ